MQKNGYILSEIAQILGAELQGDPNCQINSIASLEKARAGQISFLVNSRYQLVASARHEKFLATTQASAVLLSPLHAEQCPANKLIMQDPYQGYIKLATLFEKKFTAAPGIHSSAIIGSNCQIAASASIGPHCVIGDRLSYW